MITVIVVIIILIGISLVMGYIYYNKRQTQQKRKAQIISKNNELKKEIEDLAKSAKEVNDTFDQVITDEDLRVNDFYLTDGIAPSNETIEILKGIGTEVGISLGAVAAVKITKKGAFFLGNKAIQTSVGKMITRMLPKAALKASVTLAKSIGKLSNPVGWALAVFDLTSVLWDITDVGKLSSYKDAKAWLELRDIYKKEMDKAVKESGGDPTKKVVVGPLTKLQKEEERWVKEFTIEFEKQVTKFVDKAINEIDNIGDKSEQEIIDEMTRKVESNEAKITNITFRLMCEKEGGKYLGRDICSYKTKSECDNSYEWPIKEGDDSQTYVQWDGQKCVAEPWAGAVRKMCEEQGSANIGYDYNQKVCYIKEPYCKQYGYSYTPSDKEAGHQPNCYKTSGRKVADVLVGETVTQDFQNLFSKEKNCGGRCTDDQYCYTMTGRGGICLKKHKVGEACPMDHKNTACEGKSECRLSSEGYGAAIGSGIAIVGTGGASSLVHATAAAAVGRSIAANQGMCTAGADGVNPSSSSNPGHYIPKGLKGCSVAWPCPTKVNHEGKVVPFHCKNIFEPCKPPVEDGSFCLAGQHHWCKPGSFCNEGSRCEKKRGEGETCVLNAACLSGECSRSKNLAKSIFSLGIAGECTSPGSVSAPSKVPRGGSCNRDIDCELGNLCINGVCGASLGNLPTGSRCALSSDCADGLKCSYNFCVPEEAKDPYEIPDELKSELGSECPCTPPLICRDNRCVRSRR